MKPKTTRWNQLFIVLLIGFAIGAVSGQWYAKEYRKHWRKGDMRERTLERFNRQLHLAEAQQKQIADIFDAKHPQMVALQEELKPKFDALRSATQTEIRQVLNPAQQKKFDDMNAEREKRWKERSKFLGL